MILSESQISEDASHSDLIEMVIIFARLQQLEEEEKDLVSSYLADLLPEPPDEMIDLAAKSWNIDRERIAGFTKQTLYHFIIESLDSDAGDELAKQLIKLGKQRDNE